VQEDFFTDQWTSWCPTSRHKASSIRPLKKSKWCSCFPQGRGGFGRRFFNRWMYEDESTATIKCPEIMSIASPVQNELNTRW